MRGPIGAGESSLGSLGKAANVGVSRWSSGGECDEVCRRGHGCVVEIGNGSGYRDACGGEIASESRRVDAEGVRHVIIHLIVKLRAGCIGVDNKGALAEARAR